MKDIVKCIVTYVILILFFVLALIISSSFSSNLIQKNVSESAKVLYSEGNRKIVYIPYRNYNMQFDNYTDALMINTAYSINNLNPLESALLARKNYLPNITKIVEQEHPGELKSASKYKYHNEVAELLDLVNNDIEESFEYARYWHGYLILLRPLLLLFNLNTIRIILFIVLYALYIWFFYLLEKKTNIIIALIFGFGLFCVEYFYLGYTLQGIFIFLIAIISSIFLLIKYEKIKSKVIVFFTIGMLTNFFDFLTVPMVTFGFPMLIVLLLEEKNHKSNWKQLFLEIVKLGIAWGIGYAITWFTKWVLTDLLLNRNLVLVALQQIKYRSIGRSYSILEAIIPNLNYTIIFTVISIVIIYILTLIYKKNRSIKVQYNSIKQLLPYFIIAILPYMWYVVLKNHSAQHAFFTYRNQVLTIIGINICFFKLLLLEKEVKK